MSNITLNPNASGTGTFSVASPNSNTDRTLTLPDSDGELVSLDSSGNLTLTGSFTSLGIDDNATSTAMTLDASGNLLVGKTSANYTTAGIMAEGDGTISAVKAGVTGVFNRLSTDGDIVQFRKNNTTIGSLGVNANDNFYFQGSGGHCGIESTNLGITPWEGGTARDNLYDMGNPSYRWDDVYATNGTIQTSDRNEKQDIEVLSDAETRVAQACKGLLRKFRWQDAVAEKGDDARIHFGIIAQDLQDAFAAEGLDAGRYAMFISSTWWEATETYTDDDGVEQTRTNTYETQDEAPAGATERTRLGVRYPELLAFIIGAM